MSIKTKKLTKRQQDSFRADLIVLCAKYFGSIKSGYDIKNILEDYAHNSYFAMFEYDDVNDKDLNIVEEAVNYIRIREESDSIDYIHKMLKAE